MFCLKTMNNVCSSSVCCQIPALDVSVAKHMGLGTNMTKGSITRRESRFIEIDKA